MKMDPRIAALSVHLFTASGAVFAMLSMLAAANHQWSLMFLWLVVAFAVDGICLLYTSPSPRDGLLSRMPSSA